MNLDHLMRDYPLDGDAIQRLADYLDDSARRSRTLSLSFDRLFDIANPSSVASLSKIVQDLIDSKVLVEVFRVESEPGVGSENFATLGEIPAVISNRNGLDIVPDVFNTKTYYIFEG